PGRMGPPASSSLTAIGLGLIFSTYNTRLRKSASILGTAAFGISALSLGGYLFGANQLYAIPRLTGIALQTATMIAALSVGIVVEMPEHGIAAALGRDDAGGAVFRRLFLPVIVVSLVLGWLRVTGQEAGLFDTAFGTAARSLIEISLLLGILWWTANDISGAEKRSRDASLALAENEERLRLATQTGKVGVWDWDIREDHISWTESLYGMHGITEGEFGGTVESFTALVHPDDRPFVADAITAALDGGAPYELEFRALRPDGRIAWLFTNAIVLSDKQGAF